MTDTLFGNLLRGSILACLLHSAGIAWGDVKPAGIFDSHMVLQRGMQVPVWGTAAPGETVTVEIQDQKIGVQADKEGKWRAVLNPLKEGAPCTLTLTAKNKVVLADILVGEVWLCSGQSNMAMGLRKGLPFSWNDAGVPNAEAEIAAAKYPLIRLGTVSFQRSATPLADTNARWVECSPDTVPGFSAVAYFYGRELYKALDVPIGLLHSSCGATLIESWIPREGFDGLPELNAFPARIEQMDRQYQESLGETVARTERWTAEAKQSLAAGREPPAPPRWPANPRANGGPCDLYNAMIHPIVTFAIRGAIWYQGESNALQNDGMLYYFKTKALVDSWRKLWNQGNFPFYFVQLAPYAGRYTGNQLAELREAQVAALRMTNTGMAVTTDIGDLKYIHTPNKQDVGKRLALWALARTYGRDGIVYSGPLYKEMKIEEGKIRLFFDHVGTGLSVRDGKDLTCFEAAGEDHKWHPAAAEIDGQTLRVSAREVPKPRAVRFAWSQAAVPNFCNKEGLPASPFRTEQW